VRHGLCSVIMQLYSSSCPLLAAVLVSCLLPESALSLRHGVRVGGQSTGADLMPAATTEYTFRRRGRPRVPYFAGVEGSAADGGAEVVSAAEEDAPAVVTEAGRLTGLENRGAVDLASKGLPGKPDFGTLKITETTSSVENLGVFKPPEPNEDLFPSQSELYSRPVCRAPDGDRGVCHEALRCYLSGGSYEATCGTGLGVCCVFKHSCNVETRERLTYYRNPSYPESDVGNMLCNYQVHPTPDTCGVRLEFLNYTTPFWSRCLDSQLVYLVGKTTRTIPRCGLLKGYSVTIPLSAGDGPLVVSHVLGGAEPYHFNIRVTQLRCSAVTHELEGKESVCGRTHMGMVRHRRARRRPESRAAPEEEEFTLSDVIEPDESVSPWLNFPYEYLKQFDGPSSPQTREADHQAITRILGGSITGINQFPWQVALLRMQDLKKRSLRFFCGGVLINEEYVLTAAHCVSGFKFKHEAVRDHIIASIGDHDLRTRNETKSVFRRVTEIMMHYNYDSSRNLNDIALVRLDKPVEFSGTIVPACLPSTNRTLANEAITITGYGVTSFNNSRPGPVSPILKGVTISVVPLDTCNKLWKVFDNPKTAYPEFVRVDERKMCVSAVPGAACFGDSGGPANYREQDGRITVEGVTSYGPPICRIGGLPTIYTRVSRYMYWIRLNLMHLFSEGR